MTVRNNVEPGSVLYTDTYVAYQARGDESEHGLPSVTSMVGFTQMDSKISALADAPPEGDLCERRTIPSV